MGLIKAGLGAAGGVLADERKEFFYCESMEKEVLVKKGQKRISGRSSNTKGSDNIITSGSVIAVADAMKPEASNEAGAMTGFLGMKKTISLLLTMVVCATIFVGCEGPDDPVPIENSENNSLEVTGEMYDTGRFRALVPEGWKAFPIPDVFADEPDAVKTSCFQIIKDGTSAQDVHSKPYIQLEYYGSDITMTVPDREQLKNVEDVAPMQLGAYTWIGFIGEDYFGGYGKGTIGRIACLWTEEGNIQYQAVIRLEFNGKNQKVTLEDKALQAILSSVEPSDDSACN